MSNSVRFIVTARRSTLHDATARELPTLIKRLQRDGFTVSVRVAAKEKPKP